ncbi:MAG: hypothetical protein KKF48_05005 [Nanoarchaeota archaeon]|nr:hypothetical protein [Nanoarchaeota archaeon]MBU1028376.1 hypothetical protein [Nanoarchaeota archaeon]
MKNKLSLSLIVGIFLVSLVSASYCCEKTKTGAWCQNVDEEADCNTAGGLSAAPTSCEATSYCRLGCCYNTKQGTCMENTPQKICENPENGVKGGVWKDVVDCDIPQCNLGCCLIGDQAAFVTQTRCKNLASYYGLETNFRQDISNELECILSATSDVKGACVFEEDFQKTCLFTTQKKCKEISDAEFHEGYLCSADELATNCGPSDKTTCVEGKDEVYFLDNCGNLANIFWKGSDVPSDYWTKIYKKVDSCGYNSNNGNANSNTCGNCDYLVGSTCKEDKGNHVCEDLSCEYDTDQNGNIDSDEQYKHGETWCVESGGVSKISVDSKGDLTGNINYVKDNLPGSRYFRLICYNGEVTIEPCADYRQEICVESNNDEFNTAACVVNRWETCVTQTNEDDCLNQDKRDCVWINSGNLKEDVDDYNKEKLNKDVKNDGEYGYEYLFQYICVPKYAPGYDFWQEGDSEEICSISDYQGIVTYTTDLFHQPNRDRSDCDPENGNCFLITNQWKGVKNNFCGYLGDCGGKDNYLDEKGYYTWDDIYKREDYKK